MHQIVNGFLANIDPKRTCSPTRYGRYYPTPQWDNLFPYFLLEEHWLSRQVVLNRPVMTTLCLTILYSHSAPPGRHNGQVLRSEQQLHGEALFTALLMNLFSLTHLTASQAESLTLSARNLLCLVWTPSWAHVSLIAPTCPSASLATPGQFRFPTWSCCELEWRTPPYTATLWGIYNILPPLS